MRHVASQEEWMQHGNRWSYENVARCELQKENWTGNRKIFENVHLRKFNFEAFRGTFLPRVRIRGKNHMRVSNQWNSGWKCFVGSTTKSHRISTCEKEVVPKFWVPSPASRFQWYCGWGNFFRIRKVATCTSSLPARWSTSGSGHQWLVIATKIHGGVAGLDGKESFEHVQNPLPKRSLWYIYIDTFEWYTLIYYDILKRLWSCTINYWTRTCRSTPSRVLVVSASHLGSINFTWVLNFKALSTTNVGHVLPSLDVHPSQQVVHNHGYFEELQLPGHKRDV